MYIITYIIYIITYIICLHKTGKHEKHKAKSEKKMAQRENNSQSARN